LDRIAKQIGLAGTAAAGFAFIISAIIGFGVQRQSWKMILEYLIVSITVLAVAVPEGLPLAVTLSLAFSSGKMAKENNMVKSLSACETMGCATTICTDKTGAETIAFSSFLQYSSLYNIQLKHFLCFILLSI
jgi:P-type E1-E2 ATPase